MKRLTKKDWQVINRALALLEATPADDFDEEAQALHEGLIERVRDKVHDRLARYKDPYEKEAQ